MDLLYEIQIQCHGSYSFHDLNTWLLIQRITVCFMLIYIYIYISRILGLFDHFHGCFSKTLKLVYKNTGFCHGL